MALDFQENVSLKDYCTMRVGGAARYLVHVKSKEDVVEAVSFAKGKDIPQRVIGGGTNTLFTDEGYHGLVIVDGIKGMEIMEQDEASVLIKCSAGEIWDDLVKRSIDMELSGIEATSIVPGTVGAAPVHNVGCYGQEVSETITELTAYDTSIDEFVNILGGECGFKYRTSRFEQEDKGKFIITDVTFKLRKIPMEPPFYKDVEKYFEENNILEYSPAAVREAVMAIRNRKLPDPKVIPNNGSFFRNPVIGKNQFDELIQRVPSLKEIPSGWSQPPHWILADGKVKLAAARLVELAGFSNYEDAETGMATWPRQNLVLINKSAKSADDVMVFKDKIISAVMDKFGVELEEEVEIIDP
ncbi:MAG: UDP-N-acetylmuramate dehydrogenase [Patescibacteria group bacterium]|nr:UDP-N-acetylmuramate dehydrogenase [Patescibacteria group bacterium]